MHSFQMHEQMEAIMSAYVSALPVMPTIRNPGAAFLVLHFIPCVAHMDDCCLGLVVCNTLLFVFPTESFSVAGD